MSETPPPDRQRREATVVFADISGFTAMSEKTDPEEMTAVMNRCFRRLERIVREHGGHVDKYIGDAVMAVFGVPHPTPEAPRQAIRAALAMRAALASLNQEERLPVRLDVHIGINSGPVLAGHVGGAVRRDFTVTGEVVDLAARLTDGAPKGSIYVGPDTYRATVGEVEYREIGRPKVKGRRLTITAYEVLGLRETPRAGAAAGAAPPASGEPPGAPGAGRAGLVAQVMALEEVAAAMLADGRPLAPEREPGFASFVDLLRQWAAIGAHDDAPAALAKLEAAVAPLFGDDADDAVRSVATLMGIRPPGPQAPPEDEPSEERIVHGTRELLRRMAAATAPAFEDLRRQTTVVFAELLGLADTSEHADPTDRTAILDRCFESFEQIVREHAGHVDKYVGDMMMALFGAPVAIEAAPRQAVNAAIEMRNALARIRAETEPRLRLDVRIGINSGLVLAGHVGGAVRRDFTVMGDTVNLAARLTQAASAGAIFVGPATHRYTGHEFEYRDLGRLKVKGKELPVAAYEVLSSREQVHRARPARADSRIGSALVGRERDLEGLRASLAGVAGGRGGIVHVIAEAGMGKSRLMAEAMALEEVAAVRLLEGRSLSVSQGLAFHPFVDLLRAWAGIGDDDGEQRALGKLEAAVGALCADQTGEILPPVATLMGIHLTGSHAERLAGIGGESLERLIMRSMRELLRRLAAAQPLVLVFEDFHWADLSSQKLLEFMLRLVVDTPILFVLVVRPDPAIERLLKAVRDEHPRQLLEIKLQRLGALECELLIRNLLKTDELPSALRTTIARKAEGNPFFIEEVIRSLIDQGVLEQRQGVFRVTGDIEAVVIPATIEGVIMARVDRLAPRPRRLLQVASVIGRRAPHRVLAAIVEHEGELELGLRHLARSQLLEASGSAEELEYVFKHALIQETVYGSILQKTRKELHVAVARSIEALYAERLAEFYGMLAYHYSHAEDLEKAEDYLFKAGDEAARSAAPSEALRHFREASRLYFLIHGEGGDPRKKALLERNIALALFHTGNLTESIEHFDKALALLGEPIRTGQVGVVVGLAADLAGLFWRLYVPIRLRPPRTPTAEDRAAHVMRYTRNLAQMTSDPKRYFVDSLAMLRRLAALDPTGIEHAAGAYAGGGALFAYSGISFAVSKRFLAVAERLVEKATMQERFFYRAMQFVYDYLAGNWEDERAIDETLVEEALRRGQVWDTFVYRGLEAERRAHRGDFAGAAWEIERLKDLSDVYGFFVARSNEYAMSAVLFVEQRRLDAAREMIELYYATQHEEVFHLFALGTKAKIQILAGDVTGAGETLAKAEELLRRMGRANVYHLSVFLTGRLLYDVEVLEASLASGERAASRLLARRARHSVRAAVRVATRVARERVEIHRLAGRLCWLVGRHERALGWWRRSIADGRALGARPELARTYAEVGRRLSTAGPRHRTLDGVEAGTFLDLARTECEVLALAWDRAQLAHPELRAVG